MTEQPFSRRAGREGKAGALVWKEEAEELVECEYGSGQAEGGQQHGHVAELEAGLGDAMPLFLGVVGRGKWNEERSDMMGRSFGGGRQGRRRGMGVGLWQEDVGQVRLLLLLLLGRECCFRIKMRP